ncbi:MAG: DUF748 domain-containing protein, partial [Pseudomonadales bacterium]|nr:DUF748 domain-containing protein [Pseudomonadales bacterium]
INTELLEIKDLELSDAELGAELRWLTAVNGAPVQLSLEVSGKNTLSPDTGIIEATGYYELADINFKQYAAWMPETIKRLTGKLGLSGDFQFSMTPDGMNIKQQEGAVTLGDFRINLEGTNAEAFATTLETKDVQINLKDNIAASLSSRLTTKGLLLNLDNADPDISPTSVKLQSLTTEINQFSLDQSQTENPGDTYLVSADSSQIAFTGARVAANPVLLENSEYTLRLNNLQSQIIADMPPRFTVSPEISSGATQIYLYHDQNLAASWSALQIPTFEVTDGAPATAMVPSVSFQNLIVSKPLREDGAPPLATVSNLSLQQINFADNRLTIDTIAFDTLIADIILTAQRELHNLLATAPPPTSSESEITDDGAETTEATEPESPPTDAGSSDATPFTFAINQVQFSKDTRIKFTDQLKSPPYVNQLVFDEYRVGPIDTANPALETQVLLKAHNGEYTRYDVSGFTKPFSELVNLHLKGNITELALRPTSFYIQDALGYEIESGALNTKFDMAITDNKMNGKADIKLQALELIPADSTETTNLSGGAITLNLALDSLKDSDGNVDISIPIKGDLSDPEFGVVGFISVVMKKAIMKAAQTYLVQALVPYANIVSVAMIAGNQALKLRFEDLPYPAGLASPGPEQANFVAQLPEIMNQNKNVSIRLCPVTVPADLQLVEIADKPTPEQKNTLLELGQERGRLLKAELVNLGVSSGQLLDCKPKIKWKLNALPHMELDT